MNLYFWDAGRRRYNTISAMMGDYFLIMEYRNMDIKDAMLKYTYTILKFVAELGILRNRIKEGIEIWIF